ncbi:hypothetical protein Q8A64_02125 [Oxalobacteraceae bacterium R-40]|uniref:Uncharacterized protein n=1 Tax=Keguizhuia sedimenti TaxID=3064264 RepID=A0ABU1BL70_9BURK|nr:hypothetical protein [Oxalobacteraceae bacterium R-40]
MILKTQRQLAEQPLRVLRHVRSKPMRSRLWGIPGSLTACLAEAALVIAVPTEKE